MRISAALPTVSGTQSRGLSTSARRALARRISLSSLSPVSSMDASVELDLNDILEGRGPILVKSVQDPCGRDLNAEIVGMAGKGRHALRLHGVERRGAHSG
jgi:hypothetical protein